jgi:hypothetical protein
MLNSPNGILRGRGSIDSWKIPEVKNLLSYSLKKLEIGSLAFHHLSRKGKESQGERIKKLLLNAVFQ